VIVLPESEAEEPGSVTRTWGRRRERHIRGPSGVRFRSPETRSVYLGPYRGPKVRCVFVTSEEDRRKCGLPGVGVTRSLFGDGSSALPSPSARDPPVPAPSAVSATATTCQGRGRDGPSLTRAPARPGPVPSLDAGPRRSDPFRCSLVPVFRTKEQPGASFPGPVPPAPGARPCKPPKRSPATRCPPLGPGESRSSFRRGVAARWRSPWRRRWRRRGSLPLRRLRPGSRAGRRRRCRAGR
jgi:hypothetical protein